MQRREFLKLTAATAAALSAAAFPDVATFAAETSGTGPAIDDHFTEILAGYLRNLERTTPNSFAVCDFPEGTVIKTCSTPSGHGYVSVARMLPAMAEYLHAGLEPDVFKVRGKEMSLTNLLLQTFRDAFDPKHEHYWAEPTGTKPTQRSVEAALVAIALHRLGPEFVGKLSAQERANVNKWLASCTIIPERDNNHAWFHALNQACRLELSRSFPEFKGDEEWMLADLKAMDALAPVGDDGWYSDSPKLPLFDLYNFWTFGNFPLFWSRIIGHRYEKWDAIFKNRVRQFLQKTPYFFAPDGSVPLFGRSLPYRWAMLSPMLLGYEMKLWPHSPGLLRKIVRTHINWWWRIGAYDEKLGKLLEPLTPAGTPAASDPYIDNGHPYWTMLSYTLFSIPKDDPFWTAPEEPLPVEKDDYVVRFEAPRMIVTGTKSSGQVKWAQARNVPKRDTYRDKYTKLVCSSHFPFNTMKEKDVAPWDQAVVFRDAAGKCATRLAVTDGKLLEDGIETVWTTKFGDTDVSVTSQVRLAGEFEFRRHVVTLDAASARGWELVEGSYPLPLGASETPAQEKGANWVSLRNNNGYAVAAWRLEGHTSADVASSFDPKQQTRVNIVHAKSAVIGLGATLDRAETVFTSLYYASPKPPPWKEILSKAAELAKRWGAAGSH
jgi:hypothetical protein